MLVKNNLTRTIGIPLDDQSQSFLTILPGVNTIPDETWKKVKNDKNIQFKLDSEDLQEILGEEKAAAMITDPNTGKQVLAPVGAPETDLEVLLHMKDAKAIKLAQATGSRELLNEWLAAEKRPKVKAAVEAQLREIANISYRGQSKTEDEK